MRIGISAFVSISPSLSVSLFLSLALFLSLFVSLSQLYLSVPLSPSLSRLQSCMTSENVWYFCVMIGSRQSVSGPCSALCCSVHCSGLVQLQLCSLFAKDGPLFVPYLGIKRLASRQENKQELVQTVAHGLTTGLEVSNADWTKTGLIRTVHL